MLYKALRCAHAQIPSLAVPTNARSCNITRWEHIQPLAVVLSEGVTNAHYPHAGPSFTARRLRRDELRIDPGVYGGPGRSPFGNVGKGYAADVEVVGQAKPLSPVIPTAKYAVSALAMPVKKTTAASPVKPNKSKVAAMQVAKSVKKIAAVRPPKNAPMQLGSFPQPEQPRAYGYAYGYASEPEPRASSIFGTFR